MTNWAVTGATGFIGGHLCRRLIGEGSRVTAIVGPDRQPPPSEEGLHIGRTSFDDGEALARAMEGCEVVAHLAVPRRPVRFRDGRSVVGSRPGSTPVIVGSVEPLLRSAGKAGVKRCVLVSSAAVNGPAWGPVHEDSPTDPKGDYACQKLEAEEIARSVAAEVGIELTIVRLSETWGPGNPAQQSLLRAIAEGRMRVVGHGEKVHQVAFVEDAARALVSCGHASIAAGQTYVISGAEATFKQWLDSIARAAGVTVSYTPWLHPIARAFLETSKRAPQTVPARWAKTLDYHIRPRRFDLAKSLAELGPYHGSDPDRAAHETLRWHREHDGD